MKRLKYIFSIVFILTIFHLNAQFIAPIRISNDSETFSAPGATFPADMDNDGDLDIVIWSRVNGDLAWYENLDGKGAMDDPKLIFDFGAYDLEFANVFDINGDGILDILGINEGELFWSKNTIEQTATFSDPIILPETDPQPGDAKMADINGDGILDIVLTGQYSSLKWLEGIDGEGNFYPSELLIDQKKRSYKLVDLDNDGDVDIVSYFDVLNTNSGGDYSLVWFENLNGQGNFGSYQLIELTIESWPQGLEIEDLDGDGDLDIIQGFSSGVAFENHYYWYDNNLNENGTWDKKVITDTEGFPNPIIYDIDTDGDLDLVTVQGGLRVYQNIDGLGNFVPDAPLTNHGEFYLNHADLNNDGIEDIISTLRNPISGDELGFLFYGREDRTFENPIEFIGGPGSGGLMEGRDINGDGVMEFISLTSYPNNFRWQSFDNSKTTFTKPRIVDDVRARDIDFADFNGDGAEDIVVITDGTDNHQVIWYEKIIGEDNYTFGKVINSDDSYFDPLSKHQVFSADMDNDGDMDIVLNNGNGDNPGIVWFENLDGQGNFSTSNTITTTYVRSIQMEDIDLDGDIDISGRIASSLGLYWIENNNTVFIDPVLLFEVENLKDYLFADLDGNGWKDLIYINLNSLVFVAKNNGGVGAYSDPINLPIINPQTGFNVKIKLLLRDMDLDGDQDLLVSGEGFAGYLLYFFENIGSSNIFLDGITIYEFPESSSNFSIEDYDGDQDMDMIVYYGLWSNQTMFFVQNVLNKPTIIGKTFLDVNENTTFDTGEPLIYHSPVTIEPDAIGTFPTQAGYFNFAADGGNYEITCTAPTDFGFTTPSTVQVEVGDTSNLNVCFGVYPTVEKVDIAVNTTSAATRCGFEVPFWIDYQNTGTVAGNAVISLRLDELTSLITASPTPDSIVGQNLFWSHDNLPLTHSGQIRLLLQMPGVAQLGEFVSFLNSATITTLNGISTSSDEINYRREINCAYDPNDKLVEPTLPGTENFTLFGDTLDYTVRFQNTGTDTAFTVLIADFLDHDLDYATLNIVGASHPYEVTLDKSTGKLQFLFNHILLPDSTTNEVESHGYFRYRIQPKTGLPEKTYIQNYASIFFDFNPPILTNTVENILVSSYPVTVDLNHPSCFGESSGSLDITYAVPFYDSIQWSTGDTGLFLDDLSQGEYNLIIFYSDGTRTDTSFLLTTPSEINILDPVIGQINCFDINDGSINILVEGGTPRYSYLWSDSVVTANQSNLAASIYYLTVTDRNNCKDSLSVNLVAPEEITLGIEVTPELGQLMDGTILVQASGGQPPFTYSWDFDPDENGNFINDLSAGNYSVTVTDANDCSQIQEITVDQLTNTQNINEPLHFMISPNPNDGIFEASFSFSTQSFWQVNITNSIGQLVQTVSSPSQGNLGKKLRFSLNPGLYQVTLSVEGRIAQSETTLVIK